MHAWVERRCALHPLTRSGARTGMHAAGPATMPAPPSSAIRLHCCCWLAACRRLRRRRMLAAGSLRTGLCERSRLGAISEVRGRLLGPAAKGLDQCLVQAEHALHRRLRVPAHPSHTRWR